MTLATVAVTEQLRQVSCGSVRICPPVVLGVPSWFFRFGSCGVIFFGRRLLFTLTFRFGCRFLNFFLFDLVNHAGIAFIFSLLFLIAKRDYTRDFANATLDAEELVHESMLHTLRLI